MWIVIDTTKRVLTVDDYEQIDLYGKQAFELISELWPDASQATG
jgi:hypothetical protein